MGNRPAPAAVDGANARAIAPSAHPVPERRRTPLSIVPRTGRSRRAPFAVFCFAVLLAALATVLVLNITVSTGQYELVGLRNTERALTQENESLTQRAQNLEAPQNVAAKAAELGMVVPGSVASIDLETGKVSGKATPAAEGETPSALVAQPEAAEPAKDSAPATERSADTAPATGPAEAPAESEPQSEAPQTEAPASEAPASGDRGRRAPASENRADEAADGREDAQRGSRGFTATELNGGSIPAPAQQGADR